MVTGYEKGRRQLVEEVRVLRSKLARLEPVGFKASPVEHMSVEDVLRAGDEKYRPLFDNMLDGFAYCRILVDENERPIDFIYIDVNNAFEKLTGLKKEDVLGKKVTEAIPGIKESHPELFEIYGEAALTGKETKFEIFFTSLKIWLSISVYSPARGYFVAIFENITEQKKAEREIKSLARFPSENPYPVLRVSRDGTVLYANRASIELLKDRGSKIGNIAPPDWRQATQESLESESIKTVEVEHKGRIFALSIIPVPDADYCNFYGVNITERKKAEEEQDVTIQLLSLMNAINHKHEMMKLVARFLKDWSGCEAVGIRLAEGEDFPYYVTSGFSEEFILAENKLCSVNELGELIRDSQGKVFLECMCGNVISGRYDPSKPFFTRGGSFWTNSTTGLLAGTTEADRLARTRNRCNTAGYESVALVPLRAGEETFGLLQFNDKQKGRFTPDRISLFERLADNLAIGLAQRKAEESLRDSEQRLQATLDAAELGTWDWDLVSGEIIWAGHHERLFGYEEGEFDGSYEAFEKRIHPEDLPRLTEVLEESRNEKTEYLCEYRIIWPDSSVHWIHGKGRCQYDDAGRAVRMLGTVKNITERKQAERSLQESEIKFRELFESMSSGGAVYEVINDGEDFVFKNMNRAGERIDKIRREELIGKKVTEVFPGVKELGLFEVFQRVWRTGDAEHHPVSLYKDKRLTHWVENYVYRLPCGEIVAVYDDVTERKQAEEKLTDYYSKLKAVAISSLLTEERERQRIAQGLHDDIGQKLAMAKIDLLSSLRDEAHQPTPELTEKICSNIDAMIERVRSLTFELSNPVLTELGLEAAIERHLGREVRDKYGIEFELNRCGQLTCLNEDLNRCLFRSIRELLNNIIKHSHAKKVMISLSMKRDEITIIVEDNGIGFDDSKVKGRIGDGDTFGLFSVQEQLESFGGRLKIKSKPGKGSRFTIVVSTDATAQKS